MGEVDKMSFEADGRVLVGSIPGGVEAGTVRYMGAFASDFPCADGGGADGAFFGFCEGV